MITIKKASLKDKKQILELILKTPELQGCGEMDAVYSEDYILDSIKDKKRNLALIAKDNEKNKIVGVLLAEMWKKKKYSFFVDIAVSQEYRSQGIGKKLYEIYEQECKKQKLSTIVGLVQKTNKFMQGFMGKRGYARGEEFYFYEKRI